MGARRRRGRSLPKLDVAGSSLANYASQSHYVRVYMGQLRQKLEADPAYQRLILTEPGVGYRLRAD